jgi:succinyl-diaminopimelate desuccinylase
MSGTAKPHAYGDSVLSEIESRREAIVDLCADLVAARSVNPDGDTRAVAEVVYRFLNDRQLRPQKISAVDHMPSVMASIDSGKPGRHLVLNVHLDTMPAGDESLWSVPPFELTRRDGRLFGLGMGNMKGAVAAMLNAFDILGRNREHWCGQVTFTAVSDEVVFGDNGAAHILRQHPELFADGLICGEGPGFERLATGEKGVLWLRLQANAHGGHSSAVIRGESATAMIGRAVTVVDNLTGLTAASLALLTKIPSPTRSHLDRDPGTGLVLTANVGTITAGTFIGQVATQAVAEVDFRVPPGMTIDDVEQLVRTTVDDEVGASRITVERIKGWDPSVTSTESSLVHSWNEAAVSAGFPLPDIAVRLPASDASRWRQRGVPALCYGPQPTESAGIDDFAFENEVLKCTALYTLTTMRFLSAPEEKDPRVTDSKK